MASWWTGLMMGFLGHPLETIKVRMHILGDKGMLVTARNVRDLQGFRGFYWGVTLSTLKSGASTSGSIGLYAYLERRFFDDKTPFGFCDHGHKRKHIHRQMFLCGMASGIVNVALSCPIELVKTRQQLHGSQDLTPLKTFVAVYNAKGRRSLRNFYVGVGPMYLRDVPAFGTVVVVQEHLDCMLREHFNVPPGYSNWVAFLSGGLAGISYCLIGQPFDMVKSRMMTDRLDRPMYANMFSCFKKTWATEGTRIFYHGGLPALTRAFVVNSVGLVVFENLLNRCKTLNTYS